MSEEQHNSPLSVSILNKAEIGGNFSGNVIGINRGVINYFSQKRKLFTTTELIEYLENVFWQRLKQDNFLQEALKYYIWPDVLLSYNSSERLPLLEYLFGSPEKPGFLDSKNALFLQGIPGSGKSLTLYYLAKCIWHARRSQTRDIEESLKKDFNLKKIDERLDTFKSYVPLLVDLKNLQKAPKNFLSWIFEKQYKFEPEEIAILKKEVPFLILLDAYDELKGEAKKGNIWQDNHLIRSEWHHKTTLIVTCRTQSDAELSHYKLCFSHFFPATPPHILCQERWLAPFDVTKINTYIERVIPLDAQRKEIQKVFNDFPAVHELVTSPLLLYMFLEMFSEIHAQIIKKYRQSINRTMIYEIFISKWFEREAKKLHGNKPDIINIAIEFREFAQELAFQMFEYNVLEVVFKQPSGKPRGRQARNVVNPWDKFFSSTNRVITEKRNASPLRYVANQYSFYHKSFLEYLVASHLYYVDLELEESEKNFDENVLTSIEKNDINKRLLTCEPEILMFLAEILQDNSQQIKLEEKIERLFKIIEKSKEHLRVAVAAANAITILNKVGVCFLEKNLDDIHIPGADLSHATFENTSLRNANLSGANLSNVVIKDVNLINANLQGVVAVGGRGVWIDTLLDNVDFRQARFMGVYFKDIKFSKIKNVELLGCIFRDVSFENIINCRILGGGLNNVNFGHWMNGELVGLLLYSSSPKADKFAASGSGSFSNVIKIYCFDKTYLLEEKDSDTFIMGIEWYSNDLLVSVSENKTIYLWDLENLESLTELGEKIPLRVCYRNKGVLQVQNLEKLANYYRIAANQGFAGAQFVLGLCYQNGEGVKNDLVKAKEYYQLAADQGHVLAQFALKVWDGDDAMKKNLIIKYYEDIDWFLPTELLFNKLATNELDQQKDELVLLKLLKDLTNIASTVKRVHALEALMKLGRKDEMIIQELLKNLNDPISWVRESTRAALAKLGYKDIEVQSSLASLDKTTSKGFGAEKLGGELVNKDRVVPSDDLQTETTTTAMTCKATSSVYSSPISQPTRIISANTATPTTTAATIDPNITSTNLPEPY